MYVYIYVYVYIFLQVSIAKLKKAAKSVEKEVPPTYAHSTSSLGAHSYMVYVTHMKESCHIYSWKGGVMPARSTSCVDVHCFRVMVRLWRSHITHMGGGWALSTSAFDFFSKLTFFF